MFGVGFDVVFMVSRIGYKRNSNKNHKMFFQTLYVFALLVLEVSS